MTRVAALTFAVLLAIFEVGSCMRCYQCNSQSDRECMDPFSESLNGRHLVDCSVDNSYNRVNLYQLLPPHLVEGVTGAPKYCAKIITQTGTTIRTCLDANPLDPNQTCRALERAADEYPQAGRQIRHCSICDRDICNGASAITSSLPVAFLALVASYLYYKH